MTITERKANLILDKLKEVETKAELSRWNVAIPLTKSMRKRVLEEEDTRHMKIFGDGSLWEQLETQKRWIENGKPVLTFGKVDYFADMDAPHMKLLIQGIQDFEERMKKDVARKRALTLLNKLSGIEHTIKKLEMDIEDAKTKEELKLCVPTLKELKVKYDEGSEDDKIDKKIFNVAQKYNTKMIAFRVKP